VDQDNAKKGIYTLLWLLAAFPLVGLWGTMSIFHIQYPDGLGVARESARRINCMGNLKQVGLAVILYEGDYGELPPDMGLLNDLSYLVDGKVYVCPSASKPNTFAAESNYRYLNNRNPDKDPSVAPLATCIDHHDRHVNVLFVDGSVRGLSHDRWLDKIEEHTIVFPAETLRRSTMSDHFKDIRRFVANILWRILPALGFGTVLFGILYILSPLRISRRKRASQER
jgi:prepilin-type processing-associated H-X9-DG protein